MNIEERLRSQLRHDADAIEVQSAGAAAVVAAGRKRSQRRWVGGSATAIALVAGIIAVTTDDRPAEVAAGGGDAVVEDAAPAEDAGPPTDADAESQSDPATEADPVGEPAPADDDAQPTDGADEASPGEPQALGLLALNDVLSLGADGIVAWGPATGSELWFSADAEDWAAVGDPRPDQDSFVTDVAVHDGWIYAAGGSSADVARPWAARTRDRVEWEPLDIGVDLPAPTAATFWAATVYAIDVGPAGAIVSGEAFVELVPSALVDAPEGTYEWQLGSPTGAPVFAAYDTATGDEIANIDLGTIVDADTLDVLTGEGSRKTVVVSTDGTAFTDRTAAAGLTAPLTQVIVLESSFLGVSFDVATGSNRLLTSADGADWTTLPLSVADAPTANALGTIGGRALVATADGPLLTYQVGTGGDWTETRVDALLGAHDDYQLQLAASGPGGHVALVRAADESALAARPTDSRIVEVSAAGYTARIALETGDVTITADAGGALVAAFPLIALDDQAGDAGMALPANIRPVPGGLEVLLDGTAVATIDGIDAALGVATDGQAVVQAREPTTLTWYLVTTADGSSWLVHDAASAGIADLALVRAVTVHGDEAVLAVDSTDGRAIEIIRVPLGAAG